MMPLNLRLLFALLFAFVLTIIPLPDLVSNFSPPWILLFALYLQFFLPNYFSVTLLMVLGLSVDVLLSTTIGEHVFALALTSWFAASKARRFQFFDLAQQMMLIALFCLFYQLILFVIDIFLGYQGGLWLLAGSALMSTFLWPWVRILADNTLLNQK